MLGLSDNELQRLNSDLSNLVNLVELDISRNGELSIYMYVPLFALLSMKSVR